MSEPKTETAKVVGFTPWTVCENVAGPLSVLAGDLDAEKLERVCWIEISKNERANARLIAAAPDLLEALKPLADLPLPEDGDGTPDDRVAGMALTYPIRQADIRAARAAIAKATARSGGDQ